MLDELERVRAYRSDITEPDAATVAAARSELMQLTGREGRSVVDERRPGRLRQLQRRRRLVLAGGLATLGVVLAGVFGLDTASAPQSALAAQMNQLAKVAAGQAWTGIPGPGQYIYTQSQGLTESSAMGNEQECTVSQVEHRQIWIATDGSGALDDVRDQSKFTSAADQAICAKSFNITNPASQNSSWNNRFPAGGLSLPTNDWKSLSTDPGTLLKQVHARDGGPNTPGEWFENISDFMRESDVPPALRAALYQATALITGVKLLGQQTDPTGQTGLGVAYYFDGEPTHELIFDQQNGRMLAEEYFDRAGTLTDWTAYTAQKIVNSVPDYPMEPSGPTSSSGTSPSGTSSSGTSNASSGTLRPAARTTSTSSSTPAPSTATTSTATTSR